MLNTKEQVIAYHKEFNKVRSSQLRAIDDLVEDLARLGLHISTPNVRTKQEATAVISTLLTKKFELLEEKEGK